MSDELLRKIGQAGGRMDPGLSDRDVDRLVAGAAKRRRIRRTRRQALAGGAALTVIGVLFAYSRGPVLPPSPAPVAHPRVPEAELRILRLADGSTATALDSGTELTIIEDANDHAALSLARGRGRFNVTHRPTRPFVVHAGNVTVTVLGTLFTVERVADRVGVTVESGTVRAEWKGGAAILQEGGTGWYPPLPSGDPAERTAAPRRPTPAAGKANRQASAKAPTSPPSSPETAEDLLAAADNARLSGHAAEGAELLRKLLRNHHADPRAPLAAFTLGRMLLIELKDPMEAASVFAEARRLAPNGPLAEDSLAREIEALNAAGKPALAKAHAQEYLRTYPEGRRAPAMRMILGTK